MADDKQEAIVFKYEKPELTEGKPKKIINLARSDILRATAQLVTEGGRTYSTLTKATTASSW